MAFTENTHSTNLVSGSSQSWSISDASQTGLDITSDMTISVWMRPTSTALGKANRLVSKFASSNNSFLLSLGGQANGDIHFLTSDDGSTNAQGNITPSTTFVADTWYHIVAVYDASAASCEIFIDGSSDGTIGSLDTSIFNGTADFVIGARTGADYFDGDLDDVRIWSRTLSSAEVSSLNSNPCGFDNGASLQGQWLFDNDGTDETANANDLTNNNSATFTTEVAYTCSVFIPKIIMS